MSDHMSTTVKDATNGRSLRFTPKDSGDWIATMYDDITGSITGEVTITHIEMDNLIDLIARRTGQAVVPAPRPR